MDSGTTAAVVALFVAVITLVVAFAQVVQQYLGTAGLLRKCDSTVYGPLPGRGRRVWIWRQLRYKVFYSSPHISLTAELWPEIFQSSCLGFDGLRSLHSALDYSMPATSEPEPGQASWVAFYRVMERSCYHDLRYNLVTGDADLCPSDLPVIPVEVSLRDIIVMALMNGMRVTYASLYPAKIISMLGPPGSISCAEHNILGTIVRFSPRKITGNYGVTLNGRVNQSWIHRLLADCSVAGTNLSSLERDHIEDIEGRWMRRIIQKVESTDNGWKYQGNPFAPREMGSNDQSAGSLASGNASDYVEPAVGGTTKNMALVRVPMGAWKSPHTSTVPWRRSWPMEISKGPTQSALVPFNNAYSILQFPQDYDTQAPVIPPEAPDIPLTFSDTLGINDGCWSLSSEKDPSVVLILLAPYETPQLVASKDRWLGWLYKILGTAQNGESEEKDTFLPIVQTTVNAGWRVAKGRRIIPHFFPLPEAEDSSLSDTSKGSLSAFPPSRFPPDFLDSHIELDLGRRLQSNSRSYQAIAQQQRRRFERKRELLDLSLIEDGPATCRKLFEASHHSEIDTSDTPSRSLMRRSESAAIEHKVPSHLSGQDDTRINTPQRSTPLMIQASKFTDRDVRPSESHHRVTGSQRNNWAYVESVESDDEESLPKTRGTNDSSCDEDCISPNEPSSRSGTFPFRHADNPIRRATTITSVTGNAYERNPEGIEQRMYALRPSRPKIVSFTNDNRDGRLSGSSFVSESGSGPSSYDSSGSDMSEPRQSRSNPRHAGRWPKKTEAQMEAERRQRLREIEFERRARRRRQRLQRAPVLFRRNAADISWFWVCQMDIIPGYWATPWTGQFNPHVSLGATAVILEALLGLTDNLSLQYSSAHQVGTWSWLRDGKITFPPYARNARGGVVVEGAYEPVPFEAFEQELPPIQLLHCYDYQVCKVPRVDDISVLNRHLELMAIDSWLSVVGRNPEISDGEANLLRTTPALVTTLMQEFGYDFEQLVLTASEGGLQEIQEITAELMDALGDEGLSEAEQTFVLVALLRTSKVALCISLGPSTQEIREHLATDIQVFMV